MENGKQGRTSKRRMDDWMREGVEAEGSTKRMMHNGKEERRFGAVWGRLGGEAYLGKGVSEGLSGGVLCSNFRRWAVSSSRLRAAVKH